MISINSLGTQQNIEFFDTLVANFRRAKRFYFPSLCSVRYLIKYIKSYWFCEIAQFCERKKYTTLVPPTRDRKSICSGISVVYTRCTLCGRVYNLYAQRLFQDRRSVANIGTYQVIHLRETMTTYYVHALLAVRIQGAQNFPCCITRCFSITPYTRKGTPV